MKTYIPVNVLKAALITSAVKDVRYYLNGILLDFKHGEVNRLRVVSTDGTILGAYSLPLEYQDGEQTADFQMIVPDSAVKTAIKGAGKQKTLVFESLPDGRYALGDTLFAPVDGRFPDYDRVITKHDAQLADKPIHFDYDLTTRGQDALRLFYGDKGYVQLTHLAGNVGVMHRGSSDAVIVVMGLRDNAFIGHNSQSYQGLY